MENVTTASISLWDSQTEITASPGYCSEKTQSGLRIGNLTLTFPGSTHTISHAQKAQMARKIAAEANKIARHFEALAALAEADYDPAPV